MTVIKTSFNKDRIYKIIRWFLYLPVSLLISICIGVLVYYLFKYISNIIYFVVFEEALGRQNAMNFVATKIFYHVIQGLIVGLTFNLTSIIIVPKFKRKVALINVIIFMIPSIIIVLYFWDLYKSWDLYKLLGSIFTALGMWLCYKKFEE